jgi:quercetin dioxygenase-like cupin family protein
MQEPQMKMPVACLATAALLAVVATSAGAESAAHGIVTPLAEAQLSQDADVACLRNALEAGDPDKGPSTILLTAAPGCEVTAHYHSAGEQMMVVHGRVLMGMDGMAPKVLAPGGFALMPGKAVHWFTCRSKAPCTLFVVFDGVYDIVWVKRPH